MPRRSKLMCCDIAETCGFVEKCHHATPHKPKQSCRTPCKRKMSKFKCVEVELCSHCEGRGYHHVKSKGKGQ